MKREIKRRFAYIETCLYWGMGITARQLGTTFDLARQNAQLIIDAYRKKHPDNLIYHRSRKRHVATADFQENYISLKPSRYLDYLRGNSLTNQFWEDEEWDGLIIEDIDTLFRPVNETEITRQFISAIQDQQALYIHYHAKSETHHLTLAPNQLVYASRRYHFRAYCYDWNKFIDLVPSRVLEATPSDEDWISSDEDEEWYTYKTLQFQPNPELPLQLKKTLLFDYRLKEGELFSIRTRKATESYVLREMERLDWKYKIPLWLLLQHE